MSIFADLPSLLAFHQCHASLKQLRALESRYGSLQSAYQAGVGEWQKSAIFSDSQLKILQAADLNQRVEQALQWGEQDNQQWLAYGEAEYPALLAEISDPPPLLAVRGKTTLLSDPQIAMVGSRNASKQGVNTAEDFAQHLSNQGLTVTSGLASGIDAAAHRGGLAGIGKTVAVVATGLDRVYPASNQTLAHQIAEQGAMVSELPLGSKPLAYHFPRRNRIISGLSVGTLVIEAALKSGSLITARTALEQGREVFAVPGSIHNPQAKGCHQLIKQGAKLVESGQDVLEELGPSLQQAIQFATEPAQQTMELHSPPATEHALFEWIGYEPISLDELVVLSKIPVSSLQGELMLLEMAGEIEAMSAARWRRIK